MVMRYGGVSNRPGTEFISPVKFAAYDVRLVPFIFSNDQTYILEFGQYYLRIHKNGVLQKESATVISGATQANPVVITSTAHGYSNGDIVEITGVVGMTELNNKRYLVGAVTANTYELSLPDVPYTNIDSTSFDAYVSGGEARKIYELQTVYTAAEAKEFKYVQSGDVVTIAHPSHPPLELLRLGDINWTFNELTFAPTVSTPTSVSATGGSAGANDYRYVVTAIDDQNNESLPGLDLSSDSITGITNANPAVVTVSGTHALTSGQTVKLVGLSTGMTELNNKFFVIDVITTSTYSLRNIDSTNFGVFSGPALAQYTVAEILSKAVPTTASPISIAWTSPADAVEFRVYRESFGSYGLLGTTTNTSFLDIGQGTDDSITYPSARYPFLGVNNYPAVVNYIQQRLCFANTNNNTEKIFMSKTSDYKNFSTSSPVQSDDAITFQMTGRQVNSVENLLDLGSFVILTSGGEWNAAGNEAGVVEPTAINTKQYSYNGSGALPPIVIDGSALYQQARGSVIRDLSFDFAVDGYRGNDLTIFSAHLFDNFTITDWAYQQIPNSILWIVRSDGALLGLTYVKDQQIRAWHRHDLGGICESVAVVPEGNQDFLYVSVLREVDGNQVRYIEKLSTRQINDIRDNKFMDSCLTYDGRNTDTSLSLQLSGGGSWVAGTSLTLTCSGGNYFTADDIGRDIQMSIVIDSTYTEQARVRVTAYTSPTVVTVEAIVAVPISFRFSGTSIFARALNTVGGLEHLEGENVSVLGDAFVVASPNNDSYTDITVTDGIVTLDNNYAVIHVGLPYLSDIETLNIDTANGETLSDKYKIVKEVSLHVEDTRGIWIGGKAPLIDPNVLLDPVEGLTEVKLREDEDPSEPNDLKTEVISAIIQSEWNSNGRIFIRQVDPVPMGIGAIYPAGKFPIN